MSDKRFKHIGFLLVIPAVGLLVLLLAGAITAVRYQSQHTDRVYTGVSVWGVDLSGLTAEEATAVLQDAFPYATQETITFTYNNQTWQKTPAELGFQLDVDRTIAHAFAIGRTGGMAQYQQMATSWYYGTPLAPTLVLDERGLDVALSQMAQEINQPAQNAEMAYDGKTAVYTPAKLGQQFDIVDARERLLPTLTNFQPAEIELLVHQVVPTVMDAGEANERIQQLLTGDMLFYIAEPLTEDDLFSVSLPQETLQSWLRIELVQDGDMSRHRVFVDENAARHWLSQYETSLYREPVNARFYFDDNTRELVLVAPHVNGRQLDYTATIDQLNAQLETPNRNIPFIMEELIPVVNANATATELGITELITETTTWFYGSTDARKHNIARSAANFFGIVVAPGEEFSFNKYLGSISEADGYEQGLIIIGGRTIKGIGGGVCQVSTTLYQTAFLSGYPITERYPHGYMLGYYNDGQGPGMDATVFSPIVDMQFINNTPHHLLIENYYNEEFEALTFKFYSTSLGRQVVKTQPVYNNWVDAPTEDIWEYDPELPPGTVRQIDWATGGADVSIQRVVYNAQGDILINETQVSNYIPYPNVFHYGPGVEPYDYSLVPDDN